MKHALFFAVLALLCPSLRAAELETQEVLNGGLQFNFSNPGARSLRLGGASNALASDASAAYTNPAGLVNAVTTEVTIESRAWRYRNTFVEGGHVLGAPTGQGADTVAGVHRGTSASQTTGLSFLSAVFTPSQRLNVSLFRHELANFRSAATTQGIFVGDPKKLGRAYPTRGDLDLFVSTIGVAAGWRPPMAGASSLSFGVSVGRSELDMQSVTRRYDYPPGFFGPADYNRLAFTDTLGSHDHALAYSGGVRLEHSVYASRIMFGAVYRHGPDFRVAISTVDEEKRFTSDPSTDSGHFHVPDVMGAGIALETRRLGGIPTIISMDANRVRYSQLFGRFSDADGAPVPSRFVSRDGTELRLGIEQTYDAHRIPGLRRIQKESILAFGAGVWRDPDHHLAYVGPTPGLSEVFHAGHAEVHYTLGASYAYGQWFQFDAAVDRSRSQTVLSLSTVLKMTR